MIQTGKVYLVGAGPGGHGLITTRALECIGKADVIVFDRLLDENLLSEAPPKAERIYVGKAPSQHSLTQDGINQLLVDKAKAGKTVIRLKGGDPFVFGRGGEEAAALVQNGILFEVVPGITSAISVPAYAGFPVTHRGVASSFSVITGHEDPAKETSCINWENLTHATDTLVFLMGLKNLPDIVAKLIEHGKSPDTPVGVIKDGTRPTQATLTGTLNDIVAKVHENKFTSPVITIVGDVVNLREKLIWFDNRPLSGKRILVTRSRSQASALSQLLLEHGASPIELSAIDIQMNNDYAKLDKAISNIKQYDWLVFTSVNGVDAFWQRLRALNQDSRALSSLEIGAIGPATAAALADKSIRADYVPEVYTGAGVIAGLERHNIAGKRFLLPRVDIADSEIVDGISGLGASVDEVTAYRSLPEAEAMAKAKAMLIAGQIDVITFASSSAVSSLVTAFDGESVNINGAKVACIGPKTAQTATTAGLNIDIMAGEATIPRMVAAIEEYFKKES
jgi:uroporphyrinogen III methyltransferase/synthase